MDFVIIPLSAEDGAMELRQSGLVQLGVSKDRCGSKDGHLCSKIFIFYIGLVHMLWMVCSG